MSVARFFHPETMLRKKIIAPGGKRVSEAVADAEAGIASLGDRCLTQVDAALVRIRDSANSMLKTGDLEAVYRDAREIAGLGSLCGLPDLGVAARSLCGVLDHAQNGGRLTGEHLRIYTDLMRNLRQPQQFSAEERALVLDKLSVMATKLSAT
jgi:hypothetical protein